MWKKVFRFQNNWNANIFPRNWKVVWLIYGLIMSTLSFRYWTQRSVWIDSFFVLKSYFLYFAGPSLVYAYVGYSKSEKYPLVFTEINAGSPYEACTYEMDGTLLNEFPDGIEFASLAYLGNALHFCFPSWNVRTQSRFNILYTIHFLKVTDKPNDGIQFYPK